MEDNDVFRDEIHFASMDGKTFEKVVEYIGSLKPHNSLPLIIKRAEGFVNPSTSQNYRNVVIGVASKYHHELARESNRKAVKGLMDIVYRAEE